MSNTNPSETPNVVIRDPRARAVIYDVLAWLSLLVFIAIAVWAFVAGGIQNVPAWLLATQLGLGLFSAGVGYTASRNTPS